MHTYKENLLRWCRCLEWFTCYFSFST